MTSFLMIFTLVYICNHTHFHVRHTNDLQYVVHNVHTRAKVCLQLLMSARAMKTNIVLWQSINDSQTASHDRLHHNAAIGSVFCVDA